MLSHERIKNNVGRGENHLNVKSDVVSNELNHIVCTIDKLAKSRETLGLRKTRRL